MQIVEEFWIIRHSQNGKYLTNDGRYRWHDTEFTTFLSKKKAITTLKKQVSNGYYSRGIAEFGEIFKCERTINLTDPTSAMSCYDNSRGTSAVDKMFAELNKLSNAEIVMNLRNKNDLYRAVAKYIAINRRKDGVTIGEGENPCHNCEENCNFSCPHA